MNDPRDRNLIQIFGRAPLRRMRRSGVAIIGVGLLGGRLALELGTLGVPLLLVDPDVVDAPNTANQLFRAKTVGQRKVDVRAEEIRALNPGARVETRCARVEDIGLGVFDGLSLLFGALDGRAARIHLGVISQRLGIPYIDTAVDGSGRQLLGSVTHWDPTAPDAPCAACRYPRSELARIRTEGRGPGCPSFLGSDAPVLPPTLMAGPFGSIIAGFALTWAIDVLLGRGAAHANTELRVLAGTAIRCDEVAVSRSRSCPQPHDAFGHARRVAAGTVRSLWSDAKTLFGGEPDSLLMHNRTFVVQQPCPTCGEDGPALRIAGAAGAMRRRCRCPASAPQPPGRPLARLTREEMLRFGSSTWQEIGLPAEDVITACRRNEQAHFFVGRRPQRKEGSA
jgi:molybdopterin/thiamine biosynthesis adenylyltransferase